MDSRTRIDVHSHMFNIFYVFKELLDILVGYSSKSKISSESAAKETIRFYLKILHEATASCSHHYNSLQRAYAQSTSNQGTGIITSPLMMDIFYVLKEMLGVAPRQQRRDLSEKELYEISNNLKSILLDELKDVRSVTGDELNRVERKLDKIIENYQTNVRKTKKENMSFGFKGHFEELKKLKKKQSEAVYPFFAVDPRREGVVDMVKEYVGKTAPFRGVKLYTRLGYRPNEIDQEVYRHCVANDSPIIVHCSSDGFPPGADWRYSDYANPAGWEEVLCAYPNLKIDFAHFGGNNHDWRLKIIDLMTRYDGVYSDLAYYPLDSWSWGVFKASYWNAYETLRKRLMFGTDYVMVALEELELKDYFNNFNQAFSPDEVKVLMLDNAKAFLNL